MIRAEDHKLLYKFLYPNSVLHSVQTSKNRHFLSY